MRGRSLNGYGKTRWCAKVTSGGLNVGKGVDVAALLARRDAILGDGGCLRDASQMAAYAADERYLFQGRSLAVVRSRDTEQVAAVMRECSRCGVAVVPQGGNTGLCGAVCPMTRGLSWCCLCRG